MAWLLFPFSDANAFRLRPALLDITVKPGESHTGQVTILNDEDTEQTYYIFLQKFFPKGESGQQEFLPWSDISGLPSWLELESSVVTLKAGESRDVRFLIRVPVQTLAGGQYAALFFSTVSPFQLAQGKILTGARTGTLLLVTVDGGVSRKLDLQDFQLTDGESLHHLPVSFEVVMKNEGNVHIVPEGRILIKNMLGLETTSLEINPSHAYILPGSMRRFRVMWQHVLPRLNEGGFWHEVWEEGRNFAIGKYTATLMIEGGGSKSRVFWVWPWHLFLVLVGGLILFLLLTRQYGRWVLRRAVRR